MHKAPKEKYGCLDKMGKKISATGLSEKKRVWKVQEGHGG